MLKIMNWKEFYEYLKMAINDDVKIDDNSISVIDFRSDGIYPLSDYSINEIVDNHKDLYFAIRTDEECNKKDSFLYKCGYSDAIERCLEICQRVEDCDGEILDVMRNIRLVKGESFVNV